MFYTRCYVALIIMKLEVELQLNGNQLFDLVKDGMNWMSAFDEPEKLQKWIELISDGYYNDEYYIDLLEKIFNDIISKKRSSLNAT
jgi:hypothetical protein